VTGWGRLEALWSRRSIEILLLTLSAVGLVASVVLRAHGLVVVPLVITAFALVGYANVHFTPTRRQRRERDDE
jgi:hypothetical protein